MKLIDLLQAVKDENLSLEAIERYRDEMVHLHSAMQIELADIEKAEALFIDAYHINDSSKEATEAERKRKWKATEQGQRQILINRYIKVVVKEIDSLKSRVYRLI